LCHHCTHRKLQHFKTFKSFSWKITDFELWHCCRKWAIIFLCLCCIRGVATIERIMRTPGRGGWWHEPIATNYFFSSVVRQMPGYNYPRRGTARTLPKLLCSMYCLFCIVPCIVCV
jgi:hypothetical protein